MYRRRNEAGFTLVELLVVIGIIAVLISILLPGLNRAREQANLVACQSNLRSIGQLIQVYQAENNGFGPPIFDGKYYFGFAQVLTLLNSRPMGNTDPIGWVAGSGEYMPMQVSGVFRDYDTPSENWDNQAFAYCANPRVLGVSNAQSMPGGQFWDPVTGNQSQYSFPQTKLSSIKHSAEIMTVWCGPCKIHLDVNYGVYHDYCGGLDYYAFYNYHSFLNPPPASNASAFPPQDYGNLISLGATLPGHGATCSASGNVTLSYLKSENVDYLADYAGSSDVYSGSFGFDVNYMRFRHMQNTTANFLFLDGHVEPRAIGTVRAMDICVRHVQ